jgi:DNA adenine methylase
MASPSEILDLAYHTATQNLENSTLIDEAIAERVEYVCRNLQNRAGVRLLMACLLAKIHRPEVDVRKPYTEIGTGDAFSGRTYDEQYLTAFIDQYQLPCNPTTAFLTPALRNRNATLTSDLNLVGRPPLLYQTVLQLLTNVYEGQVLAEDLLAEIIRDLIIVRNEQHLRMQTLLAQLKTVKEATPLSSEGIVALIQQHFSSPRSSRLPVLVVAAAYRAVENRLGERVLPLQGHNAADRQTGALGDLEITLIHDNDVVTSYEMKAKRVTKDDINHALQKIGQSDKPVDNYLFITTDVIDPEVKDYAASLYDELGGVEIAILDCLGFLRHFLHLFHRLRLDFLEAYQEFVLSEPESAVSQPLKEAFLALRRAAESRE